MEFDRRILKRKLFLNCTIFSHNPHKKRKAVSFSSRNPLLTKPTKPPLSTNKSDQNSSRNDTSTGSNNAENPRIRNPPSTPPRPKYSAASVEVDCENAGVATVYTRRRPVEKTRDKGKEVVASVPFSCPPARRIGSIGEKLVEEPKDVALSKSCTDVPPTSKKALEHVLASPADLAKAYMGNRPSKVLPSSLGLRSQALREDASLLTSVPFTQKSSSMSLVPRSAVRFASIPENGYLAPRARGRSAIYSMYRTPYSRIHYNGTLKIDAHATPSTSSQWPRENNTLSGGKQIPSSGPHARVGNGSDLLNISSRGVGINEQEKILKQKTSTRAEIGRSLTRRLKGTVTIGMILADSIILVADGRTSRYSDCKSGYDKFKKIWTVGQVTFSFADDVEALEDIRRELRQERTRLKGMNQELRVSGAADHLRYLCENEPDWTGDFQLLLAGWDNNPRDPEGDMIPRIIYINHDGLCSDVSSFHCTGGGAPHAWPTVNNEYERHMTLDQAFDLCIRAVANAADFTSCVGGYLSECVITSHDTIYRPRRSLDRLRLEIPDRVRGTHVDPWVSIVKHASDVSDRLHRDLRIMRSGRI